MPATEQDRQKHVAGGGLATHSWAEDGSCARNSLLAGLIVGLAVKYSTTYAALTKKSPMLARALMGGLLQGGSEWLSQMPETGYPTKNWWRLRQFTLYGAIVHGPMLDGWLQGFYFPKMLHGLTVGSFEHQATSLICSSFLFLPVKYMCYVGAVCGFLGVPASDNVRLWTLPILQYLWRFNIPLALANTYVLPPAWQGVGSQILAYYFASQVRTHACHIIASYACPYTCTQCHELQVKVNIKYGRYNLHHDVEPHYIGATEVARIKEGQSKEG
jgi:hypothetical protein